MNDKTILTVSLFAIFVVGVVGLVGLTKATTGMALIQDNYCECHIQQKDYNDNPVGPYIVQKIRVSYQDAHNQQYCQMQCDSHFGRSSIVSGTVA